MRPTRWFERSRLWRLIWTQARASGDTLTARISDAKTRRPPTQSKAGYWDASDSVAFGLVCRDQNEVVEAEAAEKKAALFAFAKKHASPPHAQRDPSNPHPGPAGAPAATRGDALAQSAFAGGFDAGGDGFGDGFAALEAHPLAPPQRARVAGAAAAAPLAPHELALEGWDCPLACVLCCLLPMPPNLFSDIVFAAARARRCSPPCRPTCGR